MHDSEDEAIDLIGLINNVWMTIYKYLGGRRRVLAQTCKSINS